MNAAPVVAAIGPTNDRNASAPAQDRGSRSSSHACGQNNCGDGSIAHPGSLSHGEASWNDSSSQQVQDYPSSGECQMFKALVVFAALASPITAYAQGSSGTGSTSTGLGAPSTTAGPGIRSGGRTQQPAAATNSVKGPTNLTPAQKNSIPPPNARPANAQRFSR
jgi:hypothetical protein